MRVAKQCVTVIIRTYLRAFSGITYYGRYIDHIVGRLETDAFDGLANRIPNSARQNKI